MPKKRKPYIAIELEVFEDVPAMATAAGWTEERFGWGLVKLWRFCWQRKIAVVTTNMLNGYLPGQLEVLRDFGYIEAHADGWRIRGLDRYFRIKAAQAAGASATNAKRWAVSVPDSDPRDGERPCFDPEKDQTGTPSVGKIRRSEDQRSKKDLPEPRDQELPGLDLPKPEKRKRQASKWEAIFAELQESRAARLRELGMPDQPEPLPGALVNTLLGKVDETLRELAGEAYVSPEADIPPVFDAFLEHNDWARGLDPAYPLQAFASPRQLMKARKDYELQVQAASAERAS